MMKGAKKEDQKIIMDKVGILEKELGGNRKHRMNVQKQIQGFGEQAREHRDQTSTKMAQFEGAISMTRKDNQKLKMRIKDISERETGFKVEFQEMKLAYQVQLNQQRKEFDEILNKMKSETISGYVWSYVTKVKDMANLIINAYAYVYHDILNTMGAENISMQDFQGHFSNLYTNFQDATSLAAKKAQGLSLLASEKSAEFGSAAYRKSAQFGSYASETIGDLSNMSGERAHEAFSVASENAKVFGSVAATKAQEYGSLMYERASSITYKDVEETTIHYYASTRETAVDYHSRTKGYIKSEHPIVEEYLKKVQVFCIEQGITSNQNAEMLVDISILSFFAVLALLILRPILSFICRAFCCCCNRKETLKKQILQPDLKRDPTRGKTHSKQKNSKKKGKARR